MLESIALTVLKICITYLINHAVKTPNNSISLNIKDNASKYQICEVGIIKTNSLKEGKIKSKKIVITHIKYKIQQIIDEIINEKLKHYKNDIEIKKFLLKYKNDKNLENFIKNHLQTLNIKFNKNKKELIYNYCISNKDIINYQFERTKNIIKWISEREFKKLDEDMLK